MVTVSDLVEVLGGTVKVAAMLGVSPPQVSNMRADGYIPPKHFFALHDVCNARGVELPQHLFRAGAEPTQAGE